MAGSVTNRITELLLKQGMSQKELAQAAGITESAISHYVRGDRVPRGTNLIKIANALNTTADFLLSQDKVNDRENDLKMAKTLIARNASEMTREEKLELVSILFDNN